MGAVQMTKEQLQDFLKAETLGYLKDAIGPAVKEAVETSVAKNLEAPPWIKGLMVQQSGDGGGKRKKERGKGEAFGCFIRCLIAWYCATDAVSAARSSSLRSRRSNEPSDCWTSSTVRGPRPVRSSTVATPRAAAVHVRMSNFLSS